MEDVPETTLLCKIFDVTRQIVLSGKPSKKDTKSELPERGVLRE
jgi:hypothetical protein